VKWLGFDWATNCTPVDYFDQLHAFAVKLIHKGLAYVDDLNADEIAGLKGTPTEPGQIVLFGTDCGGKNLALFADMKAGRYKRVKRF
jgi:glutaminyl-tRNA synthetase